MGPITYTFEELVAHKNGGVPEAALAALRRDADEILEKPTLKVTEINLPRPSGNIHDFTCISGYRWPNPDTPDGLPWVRRDGEINPDTKGIDRPGGVYDRVHTLALAYFYFGDERYPEYANRQLYDWFINPETYIEPNGKYAQSIPGVCDGTAPGLIVFCTNWRLFNGMGILEAMGKLSEDIKEGVREWFDRFTDWLFTHENGITESYGGNNHGSWYDVQVLSPAVYFGHRPAIAKKICRQAYTLRFATQIRKDGSQPEELKRTKPMHYSFYNIQALTIIANLVGRLGCDYWRIDEERGACILKSAIDFISELALNPEKITYPHLPVDEKNNETAVARYFLAVAKRYPELDYESRARALISGNENWLLEPSL